MSSLIPSSVFAIGYTILDHLLSYFVFYIKCTQRGIKCFLYFIWRTLTLKKHFQCEMRSLRDYRQMPPPFFFLGETVDLGRMYKLRTKESWIRNTNKAQCGAIRNSSGDLYRFWEKCYQTRAWKCEFTLLSSDAHKHLVYLS